MNLLRTGVLACLGLAGFIPFVAAAPALPATASEVVAGVKSTYGQATSVRANFLQVVHDKAMGTQNRQRGRIAMERPRKLRVEMGFPLETAVVSDGTTLWVYSVKSKQVMQTPELGDGTGVGVLLEDLGRLDEIYEVTLLPEPKPPRPSHTVQLVPRQAGGFKSLSLTVSKQKYVLQNLILTDPLDNVTEMSFTGVLMNQDIPDTEFKFVAPAGVAVMKTGGL